MQILHDSDDSDQETANDEAGKVKQTKSAAVDTEEDSQKAYERQKATTKRIQRIIKQLRRDARTYLGLTDNSKVPLS